MLSNGPQTIQPHHCLHHSGIICTFGYFWLHSLMIAPLSQPAIPVVTTILSLVLRLEPAAVLKIVGIGFSVAGAVFMVGFELGTSGSQTAIGVALFVGNTICSGIYILMQKPVLKKYAIVPFAWLSAHQIPCQIPADHCHCCRLYDCLFLYGNNSTHLCSRYRG